MSLFAWFRRSAQPAPGAPTPLGQHAGCAGCVALEQRVDALESRWRAWKIEADAFLEAVADSVEQIEHKRRQTTSAAARAAAKKPAETLEDAPGEVQPPLLDREAGKRAVRLMLAGR